MSDRDDRMIFTGKVIETNKGVFKVAAGNHIIIARLSGKIRQFEVKVIVGDLVEVETSPYDMSLGRITKRLKSGSDQR